MKKTAFIWRESIYKSEINGIYRCNKCKAVVFDSNKNENHTLVNPAAKENNYMFCPDCKNCVGRIEEIEVPDDDPDTYKRGFWDGKYKS